MNANRDSLHERFAGCVLGLALGDALGGRFEGQLAEYLQKDFPSVAALMNYAQDELWYTDDTQMTIGVAEALIERGQIVEESLCRAFVANYVPSRGYGRGARSVLSAMEDGRDYQAVAEQHFPGGSFGNGAAMRVAPVGLLFRDDPEKLWEQARLSALPTHRHPLGIEGAQLLALAVALASHAERFDREAYFATLQAACTTPEFRAKLTAAARIEHARDLASLGNGIEALHSVPTAIASFALAPDSYAQTIGQVILHGGDTDTIAAMAGAISGAYLGLKQLPAHLLDLLEDSPKGGAYLHQMARDLHAVYERGLDSPAADVSHETLR